VLRGVNRPNLLSVGAIHIGMIVDATVIMVRGDLRRLCAYEALSENESARRISKCEPIMAMKRHAILTARTPTLSHRSSSPPPSFIAASYAVHLSGRRRQHLQPRLARTLRLCLGGGLLCWRHYGDAGAERDHLPEHVLGKPRPYFMRAFDNVSTC